MTSDDLEFLVSQFADGTLPPERLAEVEAILESDADARAMLADYRAVDAALRATPQLPAINWEGLRRHLSANAVSDAGEAAIPEGLEALIASAVAGELTAEQQVQLDHELLANPSARAQLFEYAQLDQLLRTQPQPPAVHWEKLAGTISQATARQANESLPEELEALIVDYADDRQAVSGDPAWYEDPLARAAFREHVSLSEALASLRSQQMPSVNWDGLAEHISGRIAKESRPSRSMRIADWLRPMPARVALAASVLIAAGVALRLAFTGGPAPVTLVPTPAPIVQVVHGPQVELAPQPAIAVIQVGPPPGEFEADNGFTDDIVARPPRVVIASGVTSTDDTRGFPF